MNRPDTRNILVLAATVALCVVLLVVLRSGSQELPPTSLEKEPSVAVRPAVRGSADRGALHNSSVSAAATPAGDSVRSDAPDFSSVVTTIRGHVTDPESNPVGGVLITLSLSDPGTTLSPRRMTTTTDPEGAYEFLRLDPGEAVVAVSLDPELGFFAPRPARIALVPNRGLNDVDFRLARGLTIVGYVRDETPEPIEDAWVGTDLENPDDQTSEGFTRKTASTDPAGYFQLGGIDPSVTSVTIRAGGEGFQPVSLRPPKPFSEVQQITLPRAATLRILAIDGVASAPLRRFRYRVETPPSSLARPGIAMWTESSILEKPGEATVSDVPQGEWRISIEELTETGFPTGRSASAFHRVRGGSHTLPIYIGDYALRGTIVDPSGVGVAGAQIRLYPAKTQAAAGAPGALAHAIAANDGSFSMKGLQPGSYQLVADLENGVASAQTSVIIPRSGTSESLRLQLVP